MRVLITGGAGYIGTELCYLLDGQKEVSEIVVYDNLSRKNFNLFIGQSKFNSEKVRLVKGELLDTRKLKKEVEKADVVVHLAAKVTTPFSDHNPHEYDQVNNWATAELSYLVEKSNVSRFIYASSASVYGPQVVDNTDAALHPKTFYGTSKMHGEEHVARLLKKQAETYILRMGNVYGYSKSMRFDSVINKFMFNAHFGNSIQINGDGYQSRSFVHIDRLSNLLWNFISGKEEQGYYNVVEDTYTINDIVDTIKEIYPELEMVYVSQNMNMISQEVKSSKLWLKEGIMKTTSLLDELKEFRGHFSF